MIRYEIGDLASGLPPVFALRLSFSPDRSLQGGRTYADNGGCTKQSSAFVRHFVGSASIATDREWQLEQTGPTAFVFRFRPERREGLDQNLDRCERVFDWFLAIG